MYGEIGERDNAVGSCHAHRAIGDFQIVVTAQDSVGNSSNDSRSVTVVDDDTAGPNIVLSGSQGAETDGATNFFGWNISGLRSYTS